MSVRAGVEGSNTGSSYAVAAADGRGAGKDGLSGGGGGGDGGGGSRVMMIEAAGEVRPPAELPRLVRVLLRMQGLDYERGALQLRSRCLGRVTTVLQNVVLYVVGFGWVLLGMPVWLFIVYTGSTHLTYFGTGFQAGSGDTIQPALLSPHWRRMLVSNHGGLVDKMRKSTRKTVGWRLVFAILGYYGPALAAVIYFLITLTDRSDGADLNPVVATGLFVATVAVILPSAILVVFVHQASLRAVQGALQMHHSKHTVRAYFANVRAELLKDRPSADALADAQQRINAFVRDVNCIFARPTTFFVVWQMSQLVCFSVGAMMSPEPFLLQEPIFGDIFYRVACLWATANALAFARLNLKVCSVFDTTARQETRELGNIRYLRGWDAAVGSSGASSTRLHEWLERGHRIYTTVLGIPVTATNIARFSSALASALGIVLATAVRNGVAV